MSEIVVQDAAGVVGQRKRRPSSFPHGALPLVEPGCASSAAGWLAASSAAGLLGAAVLLAAPFCAVSAVADL